MTTRSCKGNCSRCCCCGSEKLRDMPGYYEDVYNEVRPEKARIKWRFEGGVFDGQEYYLERVLPPHCGLQPSETWFGVTDRVCLLEYRLLPASYYGPGYYGGGYTGYPCLYIDPSNQVTTDWKLALDRQCYAPLCVNGGITYGGWCRKRRIFYRVKFHPCELVLDVARCKASTLACAEVFNPPNPPSVDTCGYLVTARFTVSYTIEAAIWTGFRDDPSDPNVCDALEFPSVEDIPAMSGAGWVLAVCETGQYQIARSRVYYSLVNDGFDDIHFGLSTLKNMPDCCSEWGVPALDCAGNPSSKDAYWNDEYFKCQNDPDFEMQITGDCEEATPCGVNPLLCVVPYGCEIISSCTEYTATYSENVGDWIFDKA